MSQPARHSAAPLAHFRKFRLIIAQHPERDETHADIRVIGAEQPPVQTNMLVEALRKKITAKP